MAEWVDQGLKILDTGFDLYTEYQTRDAARDVVRLTTDTERTLAEAELERAKRERALAERAPIPQDNYGTAPPPSVQGSTQGTLTTLGASLRDSGAGGGMIGLLIVALMVISGTGGD